MEENSEITLDYILGEIRKRLDKKSPNLIDAYMDFLIEKGIDLEDKEERAVWLPDALMHKLTEEAIKFNIINEDTGNIDEFV